MTRPVRWLVSLGLVGIALTISATGHGNASGRLLDLAVVALHALTAGLWVGGLIVLVVLGRTVERGSGSASGPWRWPAWSPWWPPVR